MTQRWPSSQSRGSEQDMPFTHMAQHPNIPPVPGSPQEAPGSLHLQRGLPEPWGALVGASLCLRLELEQVRAHAGSEHWDQALELWQKRGEERWYWEQEMRTGGQRGSQVGVSPAPQQHTGARQGLQDFLEPSGVWRGSMGKALESAIRGGPREGQDVPR